MGGMERLVEPLKKWFSGDIKVKLIVILGLGGMLLILLSQFIGDKELPHDKSGAQTVNFTAAGYAAELETRLSEMLCCMEGVGEARVMITLEDAGETVYAQEEKRNIDKQQETAPEDLGKSYQKENVEQKYIIIDGKDGRQALVKTKLEPRIQGVVVMCAGAGNLKVEQDIIHVVTTALNISTTRVCVVKISTQ